MFHTENELLQNLIVTSPKSARKKFRESIFESWGWKCMYCDTELTEQTATIDHIKPKFKGATQPEVIWVPAAVNVIPKKDHSWYLITLMSLIRVIQKQRQVK